MPRRPPLTLTPELVNAIICRVSSGRSLAAVCRDADMPERRTLYKWLKADPAFAAMVEAVRDRSHGRAPGGKRRGAYSQALADGVCAAMAAGFTLRQVCDTPGFPVRYGTVQAWLAKRPDFAVRYRAACAPRRTPDGLRIGRGRRGAYDRRYGEAIAQRLMQGRSLLSISRDPDMPCTGTMAEWRARDYAFAVAMNEARRAQLDVLLDQVLEACDEPRSGYGPAKLAAAVMRRGHRPYAWG